MGATQGALSGTTIGGRYRLADAIAQQAVGTVYEARTESSDETFWVTHLEPLQPNDFPAGKAFALALADSPTVPSGIVEWLTDDLPNGPGAFLVEQRPTGTPIAKLVAEGTRLDELTARDAARGLLDSLAAFQGAFPPFVHGDISPQTCWRDEGARGLRMTGFAPACVRAARGGAHFGNPNAFSSPEAVAGPLAGATDVFGVGATVAFLLTGRPPGALPRRGSDVELSMVSPVSPALGAWVARALAGDPRKRFSSAGEARWGLDVPMKAAASGPRLGVLAAGLGVGLALVVAIAVGFFVWEEQSGVPFPPPQLSEVDKKFGEAERVTALYGLTGCHQSGVFSVAYSKDGNRLFSAGYGGRACLWDLETKKDPIIFQGLAVKATGGRWGPEEERVFVADSKAARVFSVQTEVPQYVFEGHNARLYNLAVQPQGALVATSGADGFVRLWEPGKGEVRALDHGSKGRKGVLGLAWTPDGRMVLGGGFDGRVVIWEADTGDEVLAFPAHGAPINEVVVDPKGNNFYTASDDRLVRAWSIPGKQKLAEFHHHTDEVWALAISSDGKLLVSGGKDDTIVWFTPSGDEPIRRQKAYAGGIPGLDLAPDGESVAVAGVGHRIYVYGRPGVFWKPELPPVGFVEPERPVKPGLTPLERKLDRASRLVSEGWEHRELLEQGEVLIQEVLAVDSKNAKAHLLLARIEYTRGFIRSNTFEPEALERSERLLNIALTHDPGLVDAYYFRVRLLESQKKKADEIVAAADKVVELDPDAASAKLLRARIALDREFRLDMALEMARELIGKPDSHMYSGGWSIYHDAALAAHEWDAAELGYIAKIRLNPDSAWVRGNYAQFLLKRLDDPDRAVEMAKAALAIRPYPIGRIVLKDALKRQKEKRVEEARAKEDDE